MDTQDLFDSEPRKKELDPGKIFVAAFLSRLPIIGWLIRRNLASFLQDEGYVVCNDKRPGSTPGKERI